MPTVALNGIDQYYELHGSGEPLLVLHNFFASSRIWRRFLPDFGAHFQVILPDLRGHGQSTNPSGRFSHREVAGDMFQLLDALGIERCRAIGLSTGGMTLLHMASRYPERIASMVLIDASTHFTPQTRAIMAATAIDSPDPAERALQAQFHAWKDDYDDMAFTAVTLARISAPTLVIHGDRDEYFPVSIATGLYRDIPRAFLWVIPNAGHIPIYRDAETFTRTVMTFLTGEW